MKKGKFCFGILLITFPCKFQYLINCPFLTYSLIIVYGWRVSLRIRPPLQALSFCLIIVDFAFILHSLYNFSYFNTFSKSLHRYRFPFKTYYHRSWNHRKLVSRYHSNIEIFMLILLIVYKNT